MNSSLRVLDRSTPSTRKYAFQTLLHVNCNSSVTSFCRFRGTGSFTIDPCYHVMTRSIGALSPLRATPQTTVSLPKSLSQEDHQNLKTEPFQIIYSSDKANFNHSQVQELWSEAMGRVSTLQTIERALRNSYGIQGAFIVNGEDWRLVGLARCLSDGVVTALLADVCVHPSWQGRGIGVELVRRLSVFIKSRGPGGFAAFPTEKNWKFLWKCGFRWNRRFKTLTYNPRNSP